ncbi:hypothetical protein VA602_21850 [Pseudomonas sp. MH2]|uniref:Uncharacterized protein n=1 Tax=Pseudomonas machongensis TaxID=3110229 RepID=A0ABU5VKT1_9PSED|nr:hypothetical protein [Pseudomonas sp. MH2]MEA5673969.1 hypothetical protein [Pseudomonas sp. MH2]
MDIDRLLKKRQLNVQEQNTLVAHRLMETAKAWLVRGIPVALKHYGESKGIRWSETIVLNLEVDFPGMPNLYGLLLTHAERFIAFEIDTDGTHRYVESVSQWEDVSASQDYALRKRGTGKGFAAIALQVRRELLCGL